MKNLTHRFQWALVALVCVLSAGGRAEGFIGDPDENLFPGGPVVESPLTLYRFYIGPDHLITTSYREGVIQNFSYEGVLGELFPSPVLPGSVALYRCLDRRSSAHFVSRDARCEGGYYEGRYGFASASPRRGLIPLYRFFNPFTRNDYLMTINYSEGVAVNYRYQGVLGYILPAS